MNIKTFLLLTSAAKDMGSKTKSIFISIAGVARDKLLGSDVLYTITKAAQIYLVKSLAIVLALKIRVNS
jgi:NAD(P)-dependent dehydrogenase (short-subunit alcohol dehydrogenase family)